MAFIKRTTEFLQSASRWPPIVCVLKKKKKKTRVERGYKDADNDVAL